MLRRLTGSILAAFVMAACHTMRTIGPKQLSEDNVERIWVTETDQTMFILGAPRLWGDTLAGFVDGQYREMRLSDTRTLRQRVLARGKTAALGIAIGAVTLSGMVYMANRSYVGDGKTCTMGVDAVVVPCCAGQSTLAC